MDLNDIVVFTKVVETKSFTGAADLLGLPKSTVSRKLAQLEERLGVRLVQRTTRKLALTEIGEAYYARCARIVADINAAEQLVTDMQSTPRGRLRLTASVDFSTRFLGAIVADFLAEHRDISLELEANDRIIDLIEDGFDVAVRFGQMPESTLIARKLCNVYLVLCAAPSYLARHPGPKLIEELDEHDHVLFTPQSRNHTWTIYRGGVRPPGSSSTPENTYEFGPPARLASNNFGAVRDVALAGGGIALMSDFAVADDFRSGALVRVLPDWATHPTEVHAVYPARQNLPPRLTLFLDHLAKALNPPPWAR
ncbi:MAG: LysR family transcriptional regulator [Myxococcales bacterium]|nr:LysR family transcriptional regulator [Myxococcales bacterium]